MTISRSPAASGLTLVLTGVLSAAIAMGLAYMAVWATPGVRGDCSEGNARFCMWFLILIGSAPVTASCLTVGLYLNLRRQRPFPESWLVMTLVSGVFIQVLVSAVFAAVFLPARPYLTLSEVLFVPQGLVVGATVAALYAALLSILRRRRPA